MTAQAEPAQKPDVSLGKPVLDTGCVARQPILNLNGRLHAYELLFRGGSRADRAGLSDMGTLLDDTLVFGLERFTNGFPAFVNCPPEALTGELVQILPSEITILAIPAAVQLSPEQIQRCRELKALGFRIALDDYTSGPHQLMDLADYIRADFSQPADPRQTLALQTFAAGRIELVARRVESEDDYRRACLEGFSLFQGDYLFRPALVRNRKVPSNRLFHFEILRTMYREPVDIIRLSQLVMRDASLTHRLLRLVNSPVCALRQEVRSVESAIIIVGLDTFRRFATLAILSEGSADQQPELLKLALVRARFCDLGARMARQDPSEQYLLGLFSMLPAMLRIPMDELMPTLPLRDEVRQALEGVQGRARALLTWFEFHEQGSWRACDLVVESYRLSNARLAHYYGEAIAWAQSALNSAADSASAA